jgi:copper homeostasis protein (lipoprotein)
VSSLIRFSGHMIVSLAVVACAWLACAPAWAGTLEGSANYRERFPLPPDAVFEAVLEEVSKAAGPATVIASAKIEPAGYPPFRFRIVYDDTAVEAGLRYVVRATVWQQGRVLYTSDRAYPVLGGDASVPLNLLLVMPPPEPRPSRNPTPITRVDLPSSYHGEMPDASGRTVLWHLDVMHGRRYQLRTTDPTTPESDGVDEVGRWWREHDTGRLLLRTDRGASVALLPIEGGRTLRLVDTSEEPGPSRRDYQLRRLPRFSLIEPRLVVTGVFTVAAEGPTIALCAGEWRLPVSMQDDYQALEAAYQQQRRQPGQSLLVSVEGLIAVRPHPDPLEPPKRSMVVKRFVSISPRESCDSPLRGTYWKLVRLGDTPVPAAEKRHEAHLIFAADELRISGSGGCNRLTGNFDLDGDKMRFSQVADTRMACPAGMDQEQRFLRSFEKVDRYRISGLRLEMLDAAGTSLARFEAVEPR